MTYRLLKEVVEKVSLWESDDVQRILMLLFMIFVGSVLKDRFPAKEPAVVTKLLLQFLVPATLFKSLCNEKINVSHLGYIGSGIILLCGKLFCTMLASYAVLGTASTGEGAKLRRTATFAMATTASALSVIPFIKESMGDSFVGQGGMVDFPLKMYMVLVMPTLLKKCGEKGGPQVHFEVASAENSEPRGIRRVLACLQPFYSDPITMALILGVSIGLGTEGAGIKGVAPFAAKAFESMSAAQTPVLFLLIGLKLRFEGARPLFCLVLLLVFQGIMLIMISGLFFVTDLGSDVKQFIIFFSQGTPSVMGVGVLVAAVNNGLQGYNTELAFDLVGIAYPISSLLQCSACLMKESYESAAIFVGVALLAAGIVLRMVFNRQFQLNEEVDPEQQNVQLGSSKAKAGARALLPSGPGKTLPKMSGALPKAKAQAGAR